MPSDVRTYPLSWQQESLWLHALIDPDSAVYNNPIGVRLRGTLDLDAFERAVESLVRRHDVLRYVFQTTDQGVTQSAGPLSSSVAVEDLRGARGAALEREALARLESEARRPFNLASGQPFRARVVRGPDDEHWALFTLHHLISDAWSVNLLVGELRALYAACARREPPQETGTREQYGEFAAWQRSAAGPSVERSVEFWRPRLARVRPLVLHARSLADPGFAGGRHALWLSSPLVSRIQTLARAQRTTPFAVLLTALAILLHRYTRETAITVWVPMAGRTRLGLESIVGLFAVTLPIVVEVSSRTTVAELVQLVNAELMAAQDHQELAYEAMTGDTPATRVARGSGQIMLSYNPLPDAQTALADLQIVPVAVDTGTAKCDLEVNLWRAADGVRGCLEYRRGAFSPTGVSGIAANWRSLIDSMLERPDAAVGHLPLVTDDTRARLVESAHGPIRASREWSFLEAFARQAAGTPAALAVEDGRRSLTYRELHRQSSVVARALTAATAGRAEPVVSIALPRSADFLVAMLAVFKAGAAYLPLDPSLPVARGTWMRNAAGSDVVVGRQGVLDALREHNASIVAVDIDAVLATRGPDADYRDAAIAPSQLAYVIFTSGSTGQPKGAMVEHAGMANHLLAKIEDLALNAADVVAQTASTSFDISVWQFLAALAVGGRVHVVPDDVAREPRRLLEHADRHGVTILETVPSMMRAMLDGPPPVCSTLRWMIPTGETLATELAQLWFDRYPRVPLMNAYGPTECSDDVTHGAVSNVDGIHGGTVPIGRALRNLAVHVLDDRWEPVPSGVPGALYVGGVGVGRGYIGDPRRTAEAFLPDPFASARGARIYCTGDLARVGESGAIEYLGRVDRQLKIRGFRVEPGEVEAQIVTHPSVREAAVVVVRPAGGDPALVAYVAAAEGRVLDGAELRRMLLARVPAYMVPNAIVALDRLPRTVTGKVDRTALESRPLVVERPRILPRTEAERTLAAIWTELLGVSEIGVDDDFFESGGNSLSATRLLARMTARFGVTLSLRAVFEAPTIAQLVTRVVQTRATSVESDHIDSLLADLERVSSTVGHA